MNLPRVERLLARNQEVWASEYDKFVETLTAFVNKEINDFKLSIVSQGESLSEYRISLTHVHESAQSTS